MRLAKCHPSNGVEHGPISFYKKELFFSPSVNCQLSTLVFVSDTWRKISIDVNFCCHFQNQVVDS